mmetsp:Transcript_21391/g.39929  ORF Transcript_21391/g.39929 Transcript_21391/m.39929 type:complete len:371 (+) Transcript_21391:90-1202(+)
MDAQRKRVAMEEQRKRWMEDRQNTLTQNEAYSQTKREMSQLDSSPRDISSSSSAVVTRAVSRDLANESELFNRLTEKITKQIRQDVKAEISNNINNDEVRNAVVDKMDRYLEAELHTHTCKICFELMTSPTHTPQLLFPCGHTFCRECLARHGAPASQAASKPRNRANCPYCRQPIESMAVNQSLKDLIDNFASQREKLKDGQSKLNDIFDCSRHEAAGGSSGRSGGGQPRRSANDDSTSNSYKMRINANDMRRVILENQLQEDAAALEKLKKRKRNISAATAHLQKERQAADEKLQLLQEEIALIDSHLAEQQDKLVEVRCPRKLEYSADVLLNSAVTSHGASCPDEQRREGAAGRHGAGEDVHIQLTG